MTVIEHDRLQYRLPHLEAGLLASMVATYFRSRLYSITRFVEIGS